MRIATCACGAVKAECVGEPVRASMCHCLECQRRTGSVFGVQSRWLRSQVNLAGEAKVYQRTGDTGLTVTFYFCPKCGSTVYWELPGLEDFWVVAVGAFSDPEFPAPVIAVYETRRHPWTRNPDAVLQDHWD